MVCGQTEVEFTEAVEYSIRLRPCLGSWVQGEVRFIRQTGEGDLVVDPVIVEFKYDQEILSLGLPQCWSFCLRSNPNALKVVASEIGVAVANLLLANHLIVNEVVQMRVEFISE